MIFHHMHSVVPITKSRYNPFDMNNLTKNRSFYLH